MTNPGKQLEFLFANAKNMKIKDSFTAEQMDEMIASEILKD